MSSVKNYDTAGLLNISEETIARIAADAALSTNGVAALGLGNKISLKRFIKYIFSNQDRIVVSKNQGALIITICVIIKIGVSASKTSTEIQNAVKQSVQGMTGLAVSRIDVIITGIEK